MSFLDKFFNNAHTSNVKKFEPIVAKINAFELEMQALSAEALKAKTQEFRKRLGIVTPAQVIDSEESQTRRAGVQNSKDDIESILPEAFAVVREAAKRTLGQRHFDVQLIGGMVLNSGAIAEMRTGEGKTLVATLPAYLNALSGKGVHIVTVNDYLSRRDAVWMGQIYNALGLSVGVINHESSFLYDAGAITHPSSDEEGAGGGVKIQPPLEHSLLTPTTPPRGLGTPPQRGGVGSNATLDRERDSLGSFKVVHEFLRACSRREAYAADITYGTNNEFGFDFLRDNLEYGKEHLRQREFNYAIVDEIDSILIDEARTPLIISAPTRDAEGTYKQFASLTSGFKESEDYTLDEKKHAITLLPAGIEKAEKMLGVENIYTDKGIKFVHHLETAIKAKALYHKDKEYVVRDNEIIIVDEFTGRLQPGRRWSDGLHQAIEAKEGVKIQQESRTYASITYQNFFRMYPKLSGMTGTAATSSEEFYKVYGLEVFVVPTNVPQIRLDKNDQIFRTEMGKYKAIARKVKELHAKGQPVLIGTVTIEKNELLSQFLKSEGIPHSILNAKPEYAEKEGETVAQAGKKGGVTIATNMAGRGVDIKLGGNPNNQQVYGEVKNAGGLFVLGTERHEARRIDNQLRGRSGRQGDPGETQFYVSLEDTLMRVFASDTLKSMMGRLGMAEDEPIEHRLISKALESAQEKIEGFNFDSRKHVLEFDDVINTQRSSVYGRRRKLLLGSVDEVEEELKEIVKEPSDHSTDLTRDLTPALSSDEERGHASLVTNKDVSGRVPPPLIEGRAGVRSEGIIEKKIAEYGRENFLNAVRIVLLQTIDMYWVEHLEVMDYTRSSVNLRAYGQRDPLVEYKKEGLRLFREMQAAMREQVVKILPHVTPMVNGKAANLTPTLSSDEERGHASSVANEDTKGRVPPPLNEVIDSEESQTRRGRAGVRSIGRNDPCWCGSGKKYKKCHGK